MLVIGLVVGLMQVVQHFQYGGSLQISVFLVAEVLFYAVILPLSGSFLLGLFERSERARIAANDAITRQVALVRRLSGAAEWNELVERIVEFPQFVLPVRNSVLYLCDPKTGEFTLAAFWQMSRPGMSDLPVSLSTELCPECRSSLHTSLHRIQTLPDGHTVYSLPLALGGLAVGILHVTLPPGSELTTAQAAELNGISTDLALVLDRAALRDNAISQAQANAADRKRIAQDLHDTLAQNIAYLRLKLEELVMEEDPRRQITLIRKELGRMRDTADEAYLQVRETLANLNASEIRELGPVIGERAAAVGERAGFKVSLRQEGEPRPLEAFLKRQVTYISREALTNIEKHSRASQVDIRLAWQPACLELVIRDNGAGFDPQAAGGDDHYGLVIMRERAESIQAEFEVQSNPGQGAAVVLRVPLPPPVRPGEAVALNSLEKRKP